MEIKAAIKPSAEAPFEIDRVTLEEIKPDEILVNIKAVGICHTDLIFAGGFEEGFKLPGVVGHEGAGIVEAVGSSVVGIETGDHVVLTMRSCGQCPSCKVEKPSYCFTMREHNMTGARPDAKGPISWKGETISSSFFGQSSFATKAISYESNTVVIPKDIPFHLAAPLGCGVQTGMGATLRSFTIKPSHTVLISGGGAVGMAAILGAKKRGCKTIILSEPNESRRNLALELGATHVINPQENSDLAERVRDISAAGADIVLECTGIPAAVNAAVLTLAPQGKIGFIGVSPPDMPMPGIFMMALSLGHTYKGIMMGDSDLGDFIQKLTLMWKAGELPLDKLVKTYPFEDINRAIEDSHSGKVIKPVLIFD